MSFAFNPLTGQFDLTGSSTSTWRQPVTNQAALPASGNQSGDVRVTLDTGAIWEWNGSSWISIYSSSNNNTIAYYDNSGSLTSSPNFRLDPTKGIVISTLETGATTAKVGSVSTGASLVVGTVGGASSILSTSTGKGNFALGYALSNAQISAQGNGSIAAGYGTNQGIIATEFDGSIAIGIADSLGSQVSANGVGTLVIGVAVGGGNLGAVGEGNHVLGYSDGGGTVITSNNLAKGASALGYASGNGSISGEGHGSQGRGYVLGAGTVAAQGNGSTAYGAADNAGNIQSTNTGAFSHGYVNFGTIVSSGEGSYAGGKSDIAGSSITASGIGSFAHGYAYGGYTLEATGDGAVAIGVAENNLILASGQGSLAGGFPLAGSVTSSGVASIAFGDQLAGSGRLSTTLGLGHTNSSYGSLVIGRYASITGADPLSWVTTDSLFVVGNGISGTPANALEVIKDGTVKIGGNVGLGGASPSASDTYPLLIQRDNATYTIAQISNPNTGAGAGAKIQLAADSGANIGEIAIFTAATTTDAYAGAMTIRPSGSATRLSLIGGDLTTGYVTFYTAGDYASTGEAFRVNADKSLQLIQAISTPTSPASGTIKVYQTSGNTLAYVNSSGTVSSFSGSNTGDQTITLTGGVTGSGTGSFAATVVTNANLTGPITSVGNATSVASQTGTGTKFVMDTSPTLVTPVIGAATGTSLSVSGQLTSTIATGTAPLVITSTTRVANLNVASAGNADTVTTNANLTGDVASVGNATTIAANAVTNAKAAQMAGNTIKGNNTGSTANAADLTASQVRTLLGIVAGSSGDITETSFTAADNQVSAANITGLAFANATVRSFKALVSIVRGSTYAAFELLGVQQGADWQFQQSFIGDTTGLTFSITTAGQIQYTSTSTGSSATVKFRAITTSV